MLSRNACPALVLASLISAPLFAAVDPPLTIDAVALATRGYGLEWADEFAADAPLSGDWSIRKPGIRRQGYNSIDQVSLTDSAPSLPDNGQYTGALQLTTKPASTGGTVPAGYYPTAMLSTHESTLFTYGYFEASIRTQTVAGHWSAFWLQSQANSNNTGLATPDPANLGTEIDIMEHTIVGTTKQTQHALHWNGYDSALHKQRIMGASNAPDLDAFNTYGLLWTPEYYAFYINGSLSASTTSAISNVPEYIILSLEVADSGSRSFGGDPAPSIFPDSMYVDYVRVYQTKRQVSAPVPEPATLMVVGVTAMLALRRRR